MELIPKKNDPKTSDRPRAQSSQSATSDSITDCTTTTNSPQERTLDTSQALSEEPKAIATAVRRPIIRRWVLVHSAPLLMLYVLGVVYTTNLSWDLNEINLGWLLFAAKVYESWIVISLSDMLLYHIRYELVRGLHGVPFGLLSAPFQIGHVLYLFQQPFTATALSRNGIKGHHPMILAIIIAFLIAALAGPSTGIALLPTPVLTLVKTPDFKDIAVSRNKTGPDRFQLFMGAPIDQLMPNHLGIQSTTNISAHRHRESRDIKEWGTGVIVNTSQQALPTGGLSQIMMHTAAAMLTLRSDDLFLSNLTLRHDGLGRDISIASDVSGVACATTPIGPVADRLALAGAEYFKGIQKAAILRTLAETSAWQFRWKQPFVLVACAIVDPISNEAVFGPGIFSPSSFTATLDRYVVSNTDPERKLRFIDAASYLPQDVRFSTAFIADRDNWEDFSETIFAETTLCLVAARWLETDLSYDRIASSVAQSSLPASPAICLSPSFAAEDVIVIDKAWANAMDEDSKRFVDTTPKYLSSYIYTGAEFSLADLSKLCRNPRSRCLATLFATFLSDALARLPYVHGIYPARKFEDNEKVWMYHPRGEGRLDLDTSNQSDWGKHTLEGWVPVPETFTGIKCSLHREMYQYSFQGIPVYLAFSVLVLHSIMVIAHTTIATRLRPFNSTAWSQIGELLALALGSTRRRVLKNTGGGIKYKRTWQLLGFIREAYPGNNLELVIRDPREGSECDGIIRDDGGEIYVAKPEPDWKYV
ncbi:hypothetical protein MFIFM68171_08346 [Madurella fahalii]|uniref:Uncharacterized protein n=1 Tax=Madurella fahalii TaxID=1157608 RepID=A0ABQ0GK50_9PEZI